MSFGGMEREGDRLIDLRVFKASRVSPHVSVRCAMPRHLAHLVMPQTAILLDVGDGVNFATSGSYRLLLCHVLSEPLRRIGNAL